MNKFSPITGFKPRNSGVGSNRSTNWDTTTAQHHYNLTTNKCEKHPPSFQCWDSNSQTHEPESPPITTRPRLPPIIYMTLIRWFCEYVVGTHPWTVIEIWESSNRFRRTARLEKAKVFIITVSQKIFSPVQIDLVLNWFSAFLCLRTYVVFAWTLFEIHGPIGMCVQGSVK